MKITLSDIFMKGYFVSNKYGIRGKKKMRNKQNVLNDKSIWILNFPLPLLKMDASRSGYSI